MARTIDTAIFDLGGVIMRNGSPADLARRFPGLDPAVVLPTSSWARTTRTPTTRGTAWSGER